MGLFAFDLNPLQSSDFSMDARQLIVRVFNTSRNALLKEWEAYESSFYKYASQLAHEEEVLMADQERTWEEELHRQRMQGIGSMALDWLGDSLQLNLKNAKGYFDKTHPAPRTDKEEKEESNYKWLSKITREYRDRFQIEFEAGPIPFLRIKELVLARNAGIHRNETSLKHYLAEVKYPRFVDDEERFWVTPETLLHIVDECEQFLSWVIIELRKLRKTEPK